MFRCNLIRNFLIESKHLLIVFNGHQSSLAGSGTLGTTGNARSIDSQLVQVPVEGFARAVRTRDAEDGNVRS